jgi:transcriptional regulator with XRE-family HTH domain
VTTVRDHEDRVSAHPGADPGSLLRIWRERALMTQEELAERAGLNVRTVRRFEGGRGEHRPQSTSIRKLVDALDLTPAERTTFVNALGDTGRRAARETRANAIRVHAIEAPSPGVVPKQLPAAPPLFTGRARELAEIEKMADPTALSIILVDGMPGIGKTALALEAAHRLVGHYPDGQIYIDLHGYARDAHPVEPAEALDRVLWSLGVPDDQIPPDLDDRAALYRSRLAGRRLMVLLDNAPSEAHVAPLVPGTPGCLLLVTSRRRLSGLDHTHAVSLDVLSLRTSVEVLAIAARDERLGREQREHLAEVAELCARLPLALRIAAARLRSRPTWTVAHLVERLRDHDNRLAELEAGQRSVTASLDLSYAQLTPDQQQAYARLGLHPGSDFDLETAAALAGASLMTTQQLLDDLLDAHLLQEPVPGRYRFHDLVRSHARGLGRRDACGTDLRTALTRLHAYDNRKAAVGSARRPET